MNCPRTGTSLKEVEIVSAETEGRHTYYQIDGPRFIAELEKLTEGLKSIRPFCCP